MIFVALYKQVNCTVDKTIEIGHTINTNCTINYRIILVMILFITLWYKLLKTDPSREICTYVPWVKPFCQAHTPINLFVSATAQLENV